MKMKYRIFDVNGEEAGIELEFDFENGMTINIAMADEQAQEMIDIIQNKLNARLP